MDVMYLTTCWGVGGRRGEDEDEDGGVAEVGEDEWMEGIES